jgi:hypothetical protein
MRQASACQTDFHRHSWGTNVDAGNSVPGLMECGVSPLNALAISHGAPPPH